MPDEPRIYTLFFGTTKLGTVVHEYSDFPNECGTFTRRGTLGTRPSEALAKLVIDYSIESWRSLDAGDDPKVIEKKYEKQIPQLLECVDSDQWFLVDADGNESRILMPNFQLDSGIVWRWNTD